MAKTNTIREPLFHITKRADISIVRQIVVRIIAIIIGIAVCYLACYIAYRGNFSFATLIKEMFLGNFGTKRRIWILLRDTALLLGVGVALIPAFKMKFWNLGGNGQILIGALATIYCMRTFGGKVPDLALWFIMLIAAMLCGAIWAMLPAIFKALFNTNESLFTLMMNYIATGLVTYFVKFWVGEKGSGTLEPLQNGRLPQLVNEYLLIVVTAIIMCIFMFIYIKFTKHGYEASVVGESENTARYVGINVKATIVRTLALSGALCGLVGFLIAGAKDFTINSETAANLGFTAIIAVWIAKMNPLGTVVSSFGIIYLTIGMKNVQTVIGSTDSSVANMTVGIMYLCIIGCEFFIYFMLNKKSKKKNGVGISPITDATQQSIDSKKEIK